MREARRTQQDAAEQIQEEIQQDKTRAEKLLQDFKMEIVAQFQQEQEDLELRTLANLRPVIQDNVVTSESRLRETLTGELNVTFEAERAKMVKLAETMNSEWTRMHALLETEQTKLATTLSSEQGRLTTAIGVEQDRLAAALDSERTRLDTIIEAKQAQLLAFIAKEQAHSRHLKLLTISFAVLALFEGLLFILILLAMRHG